MAEEEKKPDFNEAFKAKEGSFLNILKASVGVKKITPIQAYEAAKKDIEPRVTKARNLFIGNTYAPYNVPVSRIEIAECIWYEGEIVGRHTPAYELGAHNTLEIYLTLDYGSGKFKEILLDDFLAKTGQSL